MNARLVVYRSRLARRNQRWRWRLVSSNGRQLANSGEGYSDRAECLSIAIAILTGEYTDAGMHITND